MITPPLDSEIAPGLRLRTFDADDAPLLVEATAAETGRAVWGLRFLTTWSLSTAGLRQVWLEIDPANAPSRAVAARAGFRYDRRIADHCRNPDTASPHDCLIYLQP